MFIHPTGYLYKPFILETTEICNDAVIYIYRKIEEFSIQFHSLTIAIGLISSSNESRADHSCHLTNTTDLCCNTAPRNIAISRMNDVFKIQTIEYMGDLSRSLQVIGNGLKLKLIHDFLDMFYSNYHRIWLHFQEMPY